MMTRQQQVERLAWAFQKASTVCRNPADCGYTPRTYAIYVAGKIRQMLATVARQPVISVEDAIALADGLERGEFDSEIAGMMGLM